MHRGKQILGTGCSASRGLGQGYVEDNDRLTLVDDVVGDIDMLSPVESHIPRAILLRAILSYTHRWHVSEHMVFFFSFSIGLVNAHYFHFLTNSYHIRQTRKR
jgi:hypothetical protein